MIDRCDGPYNSRHRLRRTICDKQSLQAVQNPAVLRNHGIRMLHQEQQEIASFRCKTDDPPGVDVSIVSD